VGSYLDIPNCMNFDGMFASHCAVKSISHAQTIKYPWTHDGGLGEVVVA